MLVHILLVLLQGRELGEVVLRDYAIHLGLAELDDALAQVAQVLEQVVVVGIDKFPTACQSIWIDKIGWNPADLLPLEFRVASLRPSRQEVVSPDIGIDAGVTGIVAKHTDTLGFAELTALIVEVLGCRQMLDLCPLLPCAELGGREDDGMEPIDRCEKTLRGYTTSDLRNVVLPHELIERDIVWVLPPFFPV
jgi:hypothetical protein